MKPFGTSESPVIEAIKYIPFQIDSPFVVSFSGGRTSGVMLWNILQAYGGRMPDHGKVVFCNTGKEREETLQFVERCSIEWDVPITWLEYRYHEFATPEQRQYKNGNNYTVRGEHGFEVIDYSAASRNGEPFLQAIRGRKFLPNVMARFCTIECKIKTTERYLKSLGLVRWTNCIGFRADEPKRVERANTSNKSNDVAPYFPLDEAGIELSDVIGFWKNQPFDLQLESHEGNCDLCFLKGKGKLLRILKDRPDLAVWWIRQEQEAIGKEARFIKDKTYLSLLEESQQPGLFDLIKEDELDVACHCTD